MESVPPMSQIQYGLLRHTAPGPRSDAPSGFRSSCICAEALAKAACCAAISNSWYSCGEKTERWGEMPTPGGSGFQFFFSKQNDQTMIFVFHTTYTIFFFYTLWPYHGWNGINMSWRWPSPISWSDGDHPLGKGEPNRNQGGMGWWSTADGAIFGRIKIISGWWLTYPSEKYEFVSWDDDIPKIWENKSHVPNHQPDLLVWAGILWYNSSVEVGLQYLRKFSGVNFMDISYTYGPYGNRCLLHGQ